MTAQTVFGVLKGRLEADIKTANDHIVNGGAKDFAEYRQLTGVIHGLRAALANVADVEQSYMRQEGDLDD